MLDECWKRGLSCYFLYYGEDNGLVEYSERSQIHTHSSPEYPRKYPYLKFLPYACVIVLDAYL